jgi:hypothetical protein
MKKRGQITIFLVLAIVIILTLEMLYYINSLDKPDIGKNIMKKSKANVVKNYAESCLGMVGKDALFKLGLQGGYIDLTNPTQPTTSFSGNKVPIYLEKGSAADEEPVYNEFYPDLNKISEQLSNYIIVEFENCLNTNVFENMGINIKKPDIDYQDLSKTNVNIDIGINKEDVSIKLAYPLDITAGETRTKLDSFQVNLPIRLRALYESAILMVKNIEAQSDTYNVAQDCNTYDKNSLTNVYLKNSIDPEARIVQFTDSSTNEKKYFKPYIFQFAVKKISIKGECGN